jgi:DNA-binding NarL/FixJ family response regulator
MLWREAVAVARGERVRVLVSRCAEAEMPIPLGAVSDLLDAGFEEIEDEIAEPQRRALAAALGIETHSRGRPDRVALPRALAAAFRALAAEAPLLIAIDDVQWLDAASARVLAFAARRLGEAPIGVLATVRGGPEAPERLGLADAFEPGSLEEVVLGPLSLEAMRPLVRQRFAVRMPRSKLAAVHAASGGNPMFALEFARAAERDGVDLQALPMPASLQELVRDRARTLPQSTRPLLELVSATERPTQPLLAKALGGTRVAEALVDEAISAGALNVGRDNVVRFTHPLLGSAVYLSMPLSRRRALHRELAGLVDGPEQQARHLALATSVPDDTIADAVERAAAAAAERGAPDAAAALAAEAVRLTPPEDVDSRVRRTFAGAGFLIEAGDVLAAQALVEPLLDPSVADEVRAQALVIRADTEYVDRTLVLAFLREAIDVAPDPRVRWQALIRYAQHGGWISGDARMAAESAREALRIAVGLDDGLLIAASTAALAFYEAARGRKIELDGTKLDGTMRPPRGPLGQISPAISVGLRRQWAGDLDGARDVLRSEHDELVSQGSLLRLPLVLLPALFDLEWRAGAWSAAEAYAMEGVAILEDAAPGVPHVFHYARILLSGSLGGAEEPRRLAAEGQQFADRHHDFSSLRTRWALGHVELSRGDPAAAWQALEALPQALDDFGIAEPCWQPILPDVVETLVALGRLEEAEAVLQQLEAQAAALEHRWATPAALRCRASLLLAREQADEAAAAAEQAAAAFAEIGFPLDRARSLLTAGAAKRRAGRRRLAADSLKAAIETLEELGAVLWRERAEEELRRASPRPRRDRELTGAERRVAALVAQGLTNREVASQLFTTVATVEAHLTRIYRKLGIRSRTQLARAVADGALDLGSS